MANINNTSKILIITLAIVLGSLASIFGAWDFIEPIAFMASFALSAKVYFQTRKTPKVQKASTSVGDAHIVIQCARPIADSVRESEGKIDEIVDVAEILGKPTMDCDEDYSVALRTIYATLQKYQRQRIHLYLSCPLALATHIGMITGLQYEVLVYQYDVLRKDYVAFNPPTFSSFR